MKKVIFTLILALAVAGLFGNDILLNDCDKLTTNGTWTGKGAQRVINTEKAEAITQGKGCLEMDISAAGPEYKNVAKLNNFKPSILESYKSIALDLYVEPVGGVDPARKSFYEMDILVDSASASKYARHISTFALVSPGKNKLEFVLDYSADSSSKPIQAGNKISAINFTLNEVQGDKIKKAYIDNVRLLSLTPTVTPVPTLIPSKTNCGQILLGYYPYWTSFYKAANIPFKYLTHIYHAFVNVSADGDVVVPPGFEEPDLIADAHANKVKVIVSVGGASESNNQAFKQIAASAESRKKFAKNLEQFMRKSGYDGVDIDWEFPDNQLDSDNEVLLIKEIKETFLASPYPAPEWLITMATPAGNWYGQWVNYEKIDKYMSFYNVMTYDFHGGWSDHAGHNSPLYNPKDPKDAECLDSGYNYMTKERGVSPEKINLGLAFYGHKFPTAPGLNEDCKEGNCTDVFINYYDIVKLIGKDTGWKEKWDEDAKVPYLKSESGAGILSYDDVKSLRLKVKYAQEKKVRGVFIWDISADYYDGRNNLLPDVYEEVMKPCDK